MGTRMLAASDEELVAALRRKDEAAFTALLAWLGPSMVRVSMLYVSSRAVAEEVVQDTWVSVLRNLDRFESRSSLRTWIFAILANCARKRAAKEGRTIPFSDFADAAAQDEEDVDADRFFPSTHPRWGGMWASVVHNWDAVPEERLLANETVALALRAAEALPAAQRAVLLLRDVEGWGATETAEALGLSDANERVLLHRARTKVRKSLETYLERG